MSRADIKAKLEAFIKSGKATSEVNSGNFVTTHIDVLKVAEHFYEQAEKDFMEKAVKWLKDNAHIFGYAECTDAFDAHYIYDADKLVENFKKAMSE